MALPIPSKFSRYRLTVREQLSGSILTGDQFNVIQNHRADIAEQIIGLTFEGGEPLEFAKQHAFLSGQLSILDLQLASSQEAEKELISRNGDPNLDAPHNPL